MNGDTFGLSTRPAREAVQFHDDGRLDDSRACELEQINRSAQRAARSEEVVENHNMLRSAARRSE